MIMCIQNLVKFCPFILKIWSKNQILTSIKGRKSVANLLKKTMIYNTNLDLVNDNEYTKFGLILSIRSQDINLILLYKGLKGKARIPTDDLIPKIRRCRNQHPLVFQIPTASKDAYKKSFFPQTIRDWNVLPDSLISSAELSDNCVSKFTSLVRARD